MVFINMAITKKFKIIITLLLLIVFIFILFLESTLFQKKEGLMSLINIVNQQNRFLQKMAIDLLYFQTDEQKNNIIHKTENRIQTASVNFNFIITFLNNPDNFTIIPFTAGILNQYRDKLGAHLLQRGTTIEKHWHQFKKNLARIGENESNHKPFLKIAVYENDYLTRELNSLAIELERYVQKKSNYIQLIQFFFIAIISTFVVWLASFIILRVLDSKNEPNTQGNQDKRAKETPFLTDVGNHKNFRYERQIAIPKSKYSFPITDSVKGSNPNYRNKECDSMAGKNHLSQCTYTDESAGIKMLKEKGNVSDLLKKMNETTTTILASSSQLSRLQNIFEEISTQTDLLALNAQVEAECSDSPRHSFKEIASEIQDLADKCFHNAKNVSALAQATDEGVKSVSSLTSEIKKYL